MSGATRPSAIGFLTAVEHDEFGIFGGYLILNASGRPLEFHCTAPVKANRAQEILYGPTLRDYLYEQIAPALLAKGKVAPLLICTDSPAMLATAQAADAPLVLVAADDPVGGSEQFSLGKNQARLALGQESARAAIEDRWQQLNAGELDLLEPFARIREALEEAQRAATTKAA